MAHLIVWTRPSKARPGFLLRTLVDLRSGLCCQRCQHSVPLPLFNVVALSVFSKTRRKSRTKLFIFLGRPTRYGAMFNTVGRIRNALGNTVCCCECYVSQTSEIWKYILHEQ